MMVGMARDRLRMDEDTVIDFVNWLVEPSTVVDRPFLGSAEHEPSELTMGRCSMMGYQHDIQCAVDILSRCIVGIGSITNDMSGESCSPIASNPAECTRRLSKRVNP